MLEDTELISHWKKVALMSQLLLVLAQKAEWEQLLDQEENYLRSVESVLDPSLVIINPATQNIIEKYLKETLSNEMQLKILLQQRLENLGKLIGQSVRQRSINTTYSNASGIVLLAEDQNNHGTHH